MHMYLDCELWAVPISFPGDLMVIKLLQLLYFTSVILLLQRLKTIATVVNYTFLLSRLQMSTVAPLVSLSFLLLRTLAHSNAQMKFILCFAHENVSLQLSTVKFPLFGGLRYPDSRTIQIAWACNTSDLNGLRIRLGRQGGKTKYDLPL